MSFRRDLQLTRPSEAEQRREECPNRAEHTPSPRNYMDWHAWAARMGRTHDQLTCEGCGLFVIWRRRK